MGGFLLGSYVVWSRELLRTRRERVRLLSNVLVPLLLLLFLGSGLNNVVVDLGPGVRFADFLFPGILVLSIMMTAFAAGMSVVWDREFGFLKVVLVAPINRWGLALGKTLGGATVAVAQGATILAVARVFGVPLDLLTALKLLPLLLLVALMVGAFGTLVASRMRSLQGYHVFSEVLLIPMTFLSSAFFPVDEAPGWLAAIAKLNPITYAVDALRQPFLAAIAAGQVPGTAAAGVGKSLGVTVFGHTMGLWTEVIILMVAAGATLALATRWLGRRG